MSPVTIWFNFWQTHKVVKSVLMFYATDLMLADLGNAILDRESVLRWLFRSITEKDL